MTENNADFTHKELCLLFKTVCENELNIVVAKDMKSIREKRDVFANDDEIVIKKVSNKQGKTKVSIFVTSFADDLGETERAYSTTL